MWRRTGVPLSVLGRRGPHRVIKGSPYNLITFQKEAYEETARLHISPKPDSILRVFMVYTPLAQPVQVEEPELNAFERKGFTAVERGGKEILAE